MNTHSPERFSRQGFSEMKRGHYREAAALFHEALNLVRKRNQKAPEMLYLSYYGLCLASAGLSKATALQACTMAVSSRRQDPILYLNLGRVFRMMGRTVDAMQAFERGLSIAPDHERLARELARIDRRSNPVLACLNRDHLLNRYLGMWRSRRNRNPAVETC